MKVNDFLDFPVPEPKYKIPITKSAEEPHLERQRGGFGFLGGPGETQMEADRRMLAERIGKIKKELEQVRRTRGLHRDSRKRVPFPVVALVGYTNAGKSTLFNALTGASVHAQDQLLPRWTRPCADCVCPQAAM